MKPRGAASWLVLIVLLSACLGRSTGPQFEAVGCPGGTRHVPKTCPPQIDYYDYSTEIGVIKIPKFLKVEVHWVKIEPRVLQTASAAVQRLDNMRYHRCPILRSLACEPNYPELAREFLQADQEIQRLVEVGQASLDVAETTKRLNESAERLKTQEKRIDELFKKMEVGRKQSQLLTACSQFLKDRRFELALDECRKAATLLPDAEVEYTTGKIYDAMQRFNDAAARFDACRRLNPEFWLCTYNLAKMYEKTNRLDDALRTLTSAAENEYVLMTRGNVLFKRKQYEEAARIYESVVARNPQDPFVLKAVNFNLASCLATLPIRSGDDGPHRDRAFQYLEKALEMAVSDRDDPTSRQILKEVCDPASEVAALRPYPGWNRVRELLRPAAC